MAWHSLPNELKLATVSFLPDDDVHALSRTDQSTYKACVPSLFRTVKIKHFEALENFLETVPRSYCTHIEELDLCTAHADLHSGPVLPRVRADAVIALLSATPKLTKLSITMHGSMDKSVLSPFPFLHNLRELSIANCGDDKMNPLSERLVVSMALAIKNLQVLSLDRISRSKMHAADLEGTFSYVPLAINDDDIPNHPTLGSALSLPSLLQISTLRKLTIRDTHLGDERWTSIPVACRLQVLDLGSCYHEDDGFNSRCTERIMTAVGPTIDEFSITAAVSDSVFAKAHETPLSRLRKLHISPYFPIDSVVDTMSNLAGSPVERISVQCFEDDVVDVCTALEEFLTVRMERGPDFYQKLQQIDVAITATDDALAPTEEEVTERSEAARRLQEFCTHLQLMGAVARFGKPAAHEMDVYGRPVVRDMDTPISWTDSKRVPGTKPLRSMSI